MTLLDRYLIRTVLGSVALVSAVLLILGGLFLFINQQDDIGIGSYSALDAFWFTLLNLPQQAWELLPITALIGSLIGLGSLARGSELIVVRAAGVSIARLALSVALAGLILIAFEVALGEFLAPPLQQAAVQHKAFAKFNNVSFGGSGAWVRDGDVFLNVQRQSGEQQFGGMLVFEVSPEHRLQAVGRALRATSQGGDKADAQQAWLLSDYSESRFTGERVLAKQSGDRRLASTVGGDFLGLAVADPGDLELAALWRAMGYLKANQLDAQAYVFAFWSRIARTLAIGLAVLLAIPFVLGSLRSSGAGARTLVGLLLGIGFFLLQRLIESGTIVFDLNPVLLAWLPTALLAAVTLGLLARAR